MQCTGKYTQNEWVLVLLDKLNNEMREKMMFVWWRARHKWNDIIFGNGGVSIESSIRFLQNYLAIVQGLLKGHVAMDKKGKAPLEKASAAIAQVSTAEDKTK